MKKEYVKKVNCAACRQVVTTQKQWRNERCLKMTQTKSVKNMHLLSVKDIGKLKRE